MISDVLTGQTGTEQLSTPNQSGLNEKNYTLSGVRHGVNFFPKVKFKSVQYVSEDSLNFEVYHSLEVINKWLQTWAEKHPDIIDLYEVGKSFEGRPILQMTITLQQLLHHRR